ncbi:hypothetical protein HDU67_003910, partial [Dinochytrium kinnereticum]
LRIGTGILYLYMKTIERAHTPSKLWERVKLSKNYATAIAQIDKELEHWPNFNIHKCKQRMTKITQYLIRSRRIMLKTSAPKLEGIKKKLDRREAKREQKAESAARLEFAIERELLDRLKKGVYGSDGIVNANMTAFENALDKIEEMEEIDDLEEEEEEDEEDYEMEFEGEDDDEETLDREFVSDVSDDEDDDEPGIEDAAFELSSLSKKRKLAEDGPSEPKRSVLEDSAKRKTPRRRNPHVVIEYEQEHEQERSIV